jgi:hypothetical protein
MRCDRMRYVFRSVDVFVEHVPRSIENVDFFRSVNVFFVQVVDSSKNEVKRHPVTVFRVDIFRSVVVFFVQVVYSSENVLVFRADNVSVVVLCNRMLYDYIPVLEDWTSCHVVISLSDVVYVVQPVY